jgi:hypothetical protein
MEKVEQIVRTRLLFLVAPDHFQELAAIPKVSPSP